MLLKNRLLLHIDLITDWSCFSTLLIRTWRSLHSWMIMRNLIRLSILSILERDLRMLIPEKLREWFCLETISLFYFERVCFLCGPKAM